MSFLDMIIDTPTRLERLGASRAHSLLFAASKHVFDVFCALVSLPMIAVISLLLLCLNPFLNPGPLFYTQVRMGKRNKPFKMVKFRTMLPEGAVQRGHDCKLEEHRITTFGRILRKYRIDELPNMLNVLCRQMSVIGPRPDIWSHATVYIDSVPRYKDRYSVRPGITGLAQVEMGYAEGLNETRIKARYDSHYINAYGFHQEVAIIMKTFRVLITGFGAR